MLVGLVKFFYGQLFITPQLPVRTFAGQTVIVTGSNVGLGKEAARHIAALGATKLILAVRNLEAGEAARKDIIQTTGCDATVIEVWKLDLSSYDSVKAFAERATRDLPRIDVLLENAGITTNTFRVAEGHEQTVTINVVSTFLLLFLLLPKLKITAEEFGVKPRINIVSSEMHEWTNFKEWQSEDGVFKALSDEKRAVMHERYSTTKLLEVLVVRKIAPAMTRLGVIVNFLNPGLCHSELMREYLPWHFRVFLLLARSTEVGSRTLVAAAAAGSESHGKYMTNGVVADDRLSPFVQSKDGDIAKERVWTEMKAILEDIQSGITAGF